MKKLLCVSLVLLAVVSQSRAQSGPSGDGAIRLVRGGFTSSPSYTSGVVQVRWNGQWGNICYRDSVFGYSEADVICHHLGWSGASDYTQSQYDSYGDDISPTILSSLSCFSNQYINIFQCTYGTFPSVLCDDNTDVSVTCYSTRIWDDPYDGQIRLQDGTYSNQGLVEIYCNGEWGTICNDNFGLNEARVVCRQLGYNDYYNYNHLSITGESSQKIWLDNVDCFLPTYDCIATCASCPIAEYHNCDHSEDVTIECDISTLLSDSDTDTSTCNNNEDATIYTTTAIGAIVGGIVAGIICLIIICAIPICICICVGCIAGASSSKRPRTTVTKAAPATTAAVVATTSQQASSYPMQPTTTTGYPQQQQGYPQQQAPDGHGTKDGGYPPQQGYGYPPQGQPYPPTDAGYPPQGDNPPPYPT